MSAQRAHTTLNGKENAAEEGGTRRGRIQLEPSEISGPEVCLGITWHPSDKPHALFVRQPSNSKNLLKNG